MKIDPDLYHPQLLCGKISGKNSPIFKSNRGFFPLIPDMNMRCVMPTRIFVVYSHKDSVKH